MTETHFAQVVKAAVTAGATWEHVAYWLGTMTADEARERFDNADGAVYLDDEAVIMLSTVAKRHGLKSLSKAAALVLETAIETLDRHQVDAAPDGDGDGDGENDDHGDGDDRTGGADDR